MKTYLFDFDGTLVDSMPVFCRCMLRILDEEGISYEKDIIKTLTPLGLSGTIAYFMSLGVKSSQDEILHRVQLYLLDAYEERHLRKKPCTGDTGSLERAGVQFKCADCKSACYIGSLFETAGSYGAV